VRAGSRGDEEKRVAIGLALFFASLAAIDVLIMALVDQVRLPGLLLLLYLVSLIAVLLVALWRRRDRVGVEKLRSSALDVSRSSSI
jgi:hypothetical protein